MNCFCFQQDNKMGSLRFSKRNVRIFFGSLFYNHFLDWGYIVDILLTPAFYLVDTYCKRMGRAFVIICWMLMGLIILVSYWIGLPHWWNKYPGFTVVLFIVGNWLMVNTVFHYYMGVKCPPGYPSGDIFSTEYATVCKKCIRPKPYRTHHCTICDKCILLMDHHCPWMDNCIGHFNRRHFFMYMAYVFASLIFLIIFGVEIFYLEVWLHMFPPSEANGELYGHPVETSQATEVNSIESEETGETYESLRRRVITSTAVICAGVAAAIGILLIRHTKMISKGETSIETHINRSERERCDAKNEVYVNPYDFGFYKNWTLFLGIENDSERSWRHVLFPSTHKPFGNGINWPTVTSSEFEWFDFLHYKYQ